MLCVEKITVAPFVAQGQKLLFQEVGVDGSNPEKGSSKISRRGSCSTVTMNCTFWAMPFESSSSTFLSHHSGFRTSRTTFSRAMASRRESPLQPGEEEGLFAHLHLLVEAALLGEVADAVDVFGGDLVPVEEDAARCRAR